MAGHPDVVMSRGGGHSGVFAVIAALSTAPGFGEVDRRAPRGREKEGTAKLPVIHRHFRKKALRPEQET